MRRRRFLTISAAALAVPAAAQTAIAEWHGRALGADARIVLNGLDGWQAQRLFKRIERTLAGIEAQFSLFRDSALTRLNRDARLSHPAPDFLGLCALADQVHAATQGAFDPSVQPLWHAQATGGDVQAARRLIGWDRVHFGPEEARLTPGMALTFNGIAQGWAADRIADLLKAEGLRDILVDIGEIVARGNRPGGGPWQAGIARPDGDIRARVPLANVALATSSPDATRTLSGQHHILDPRGGAARWKLVAVTAPDAAIADALSTAFCVMRRNDIERAVGRFPGARIAALI